MARMKKAQLISAIMRLQDRYEQPFDFWQDVTGWLEAEGVDETDIIRITLEELQSKKLLVPLLIEAFKENIIDWTDIDSIAGNYSTPIIKKLLEQQNMNTLDKAYKWFSSE